MTLSRQSLRASRGHVEINYAALLATVIIGVAAGNLISNWVTARVVAYQAEVALSELNKANAARAVRAQESAAAQARENEAAVAAQQEQVRERRRNDREGVRLRQTCEEWRRADAQLNTYTTKSEMAKHCGAHERYVEFGQLQPSR
jgi:hypothetical protein